MKTTADEICGWIGMSTFEMFSKEGLCWGLVDGVGMGGGEEVGGGVEVNSGTSHPAGLLAAEATSACLL